VSAKAARKSRKSKSEKRKSLFLLTEAQAVLTWGVILALAALVGGIYLFQTSGIASVGRQVQILRSELNEIKRVNGELEREIAEAQSLDRLQEEAVRLGFGHAQPEDVEYIVIPNYPAANLVAPASRIEPVPEPAETIQEALWISFQASIGNLIRGESP
jgi:cell division protein FtsL